MLDILYNFIYLTISAFFIGSVWWGMLRFLDKAGGFKFREEFKELANNDLALAIYLGLRLLATAILFAPLLRVIL